MYDLIIIGSGAAGLSAALYAGRYQMKTLIIEGEFGGETMTAGEIANYPGFRPADGYELISIMKEQAKAAGVEVRSGWAKRIARRAEGFVVYVQDGEEQTQFVSKAVILAIGAKRRHLGLPNEQKFVGKGLHYCWTCDGPLYGGKTVAMVGGGDSSVKGVNFLGKYAKKIYLITKESAIKAEPVNQESMDKLGDVVEILAGTEVKELGGERQLDFLVLSKEYQGSSSLKVDGLFVEIGFDPDKTFAEQMGLETDEKGYLKVDNMMRTKTPGLYVAGDATRHFGDFKQDITVAAMGAVAATAAYEYLQSHR
ncbi:MAG: hypothetical protein A3E07_00055 [Candidatus Wildermuthbacteria bacterium RIFCSPHIGHO2_12_FULL_45_9]|uniref:FAD/NAD(P)-binding domain-containing protein n=1 Tax=Candidatus Wildermuthbacteria bacterium RIFCSPHIGHO2_02_FULL_45_25 TaxID=1802450 RepID=A0A1G2R451_9BACT|nr:MAG: hypothetical protein A2748_00775 [Candidatus Wildermuthbacteria bacterium RIFCSPHIGHO2_01_FULL_45_20]OHA67507.1 MAG: hypothetical protein A3C04_00315 [Candidatus Wildermuthbacteria bacterium RIFCSPHIGHO2_02_FULL_45_25]OHA72119.1 MAG: hypothetical protein A3E07_00055 [Candidatus Wildermuthbacteria bacterium RIFCSPHIGHO2_12_FULL_45_9]